MEFFCGPVIEYSTLSCWPEPIIYHRSKLTRNIFITKDFPISIQLPNIFPRWGHLMADAIRDGLEYFFLSNLHSQLLRHVYHLFIQLNKSFFKPVYADDF